jgi:hypothetical protein
MIKIIAYGAGKGLELSYPRFDKSKVELIAIILYSQRINYQDNIKALYRRICKEMTR